MLEKKGKNAEVLDIRSSIVATLDECLSIDNKLKYCGNACDPHGSLEQMTQYSSYEMWHGEYSSIVFLELENWLSALQFPCIFLMYRYSNVCFSQQT